MPVPAGHATLAVIVASTSEAAAKVTAGAEEGGPVRKAHTVVTEVSSERPTEAARGEFIVYEAAVLAVACSVTETPVVMVDEGSGMIVSPVGTKVPAKVHTVLQLTPELEN